MKEKLIVETALGGEEVGLYHFDEETEETTKIDPSPSSVKEGAKMLECSEPLVAALVYLVEQINDLRQFAVSDLTDLYKEIKDLKDK